MQVRIIITTPTTTMYTPTSKRNAERSSTRPTKGRSNS